MAANLAMSVADPDGLEPRKILSESLEHFAALAFSRFPEVMMALGNPALSREFELSPARSACTVINETPDGKLVQVVLTRAGASGPGAFVQCTEGMDHRPADHLCQGRSVVGNSARHTQVAPLGMGPNEVQSGMQAADLSTQRRSTALVGLHDEQRQKQGIAGAGVFARDDEIYVIDRCLGSNTCNRAAFHGPAVVPSCPLIEDGPSAEADENVKHTGKSDRGLESKALSRKCDDGSTVGDLCPMAGRVSTDANTRDNAMPTRKSVGHSCSSAEECLSANAQFARATFDTHSPCADFFCTGGAAYQDGNSESRNEHSRPSESRTPNQGMTHVRNPTPASAGTPPPGRALPSTTKEQKRGRQASYRSLEKECFEPATPRTPGSYGPWSRHLQGKACRTETPVIAQCGRS